MSQERALRRLLAASATFAAAVAVHPVVAPAALPTDFQLGFEGVHRPATFPSAIGPQHEGRFAASAPFCPTGTAVDVSHEQGAPPAALRDFTCADGTGSISIHVANLPGEHLFGATGAWRIVGGTGEYSALRGMGTWTTASAGGDPADLASVVFHTDLAGVAGHDSVAPRLAIAHVRLRRRGRGYVLRTTFRTGDDERRNEVGYRVTVRAGSTRLASRSGSTSARRRSLSLRLRPGRRVRRVRLAITATDPLGNRRRVTRVVRLRG